MSDLKELSMAIGNTQIKFTMDALSGRDHVVHQCIASGLTYYELPLPTVLMALAQEANGKFLDVGANTGLYSLLAAASNLTLRTVGFEPVPSVRALMERNLAENFELAQRISLSPYALSRLGPGSQPRKTGHRIDFLKVDVEGHEKSMFEGGLNVLASHRPIIIVELLGGTDFDYFDSFLSEFKYIDIALFPGEAKRMARPAFEKDAWNHVFCPTERAWTFACTCRRIGLPIG